MALIKRNILRNISSDYRRKLTVLNGIFILCVILILCLLKSLLFDTSYTKQMLVKFDRNIPLIWVGGVPRSGTTLMRSMLDAHEEVRCGQETHIIPRILGMHSQMVGNNATMAMGRFNEAGVTRDVLLNATAAYLLNIISLHGAPAPRLCNKDPFTLNSIGIVTEMFPKSKFIFMIRDGRATAHSIISRRVGIQGFDISTYRGCLTSWNRVISQMHKLCANAGSQHCLPVYYEQLVLHPKSEMKKILTFLDIKWSENVLRHEDFIGQETGVILSSKEMSTGQVKKPVNLEGLTSWVDYIPDDVKKDMKDIAPMLETLGYDINAYPPNYGTPDKEVVENTRKVIQDRQIFGPTLAEKAKMEREKIFKENGGNLIQKPPQGQKQKMQLSAKTMVQKPKNKKSQKQQKQQKKPSQQQQQKQQKGKAKGEDDMDLYDIPYQPYYAQNRNIPLFDRNGKEAGVSMQINGPSSIFVTDDEPVDWKGMTESTTDDSEMEGGGNGPVQQDTDPDMALYELEQPQDLGRARDNQFKLYDKRGKMDDRVVGSIHNGY